MHHRERERGAGALAQTQPQVEDRLEPERVEHQGVAGSVDRVAASIEPAHAGRIRAATSAAAR